jgi:hypothetical protein
MASAPAIGKPRRGTFPNGMQYVTWGSGPKTLLFIQGWPGSAVPKGMLFWMSRRLFDAYVKAGFAVWSSPVVGTCRLGTPWPTWRTTTPR